MDITTLEDLKKWVTENIIPLIKPKTAVLLSGSLGAGKTQFVKTTCEVLKVHTVATSPTFSIINEYNYANKLIYHIDLYRVKTEEEISGIGFWDLFNNQDAIIFIEWPENFNSNHIPNDWKKLEIHIEQNNGKRQFKIKPHPNL